MKKSKTLIFAFFVICMLLAGTASVSAECTGVYVGPEASSDGSVILARCNDTQGTNPSRVNVMPRSATNCCLHLFTPKTTTKKNVILCVLRQIKK